MNIMSFILSLFTFFTVAYTSPIVHIQSVGNTGGDANESASKNDNSAVNNIQSRNPFLRAKRAVANCTVPSNWPSLITELNTFLNATTVIALSPQQQSLAPIPTNQPATCPGPNDTWWPGSTDNLKSTCPWIYRDVDLGESFYPRYLRYADCLCTYCVRATAMGCQNLRQEVTVLQRVACKNGLAVMSTMKLSVPVGCYCAGAQVQHPPPVVGPPATD